MGACVPIPQMQTPEPQLDPEFWKKFCEFLLTRRSGSVSWNIRDGEVLGLTITEHVNRKR